MDPIMQSVLIGAISSACTIAAIRVELRWLRRDVDRLNKCVFPTEPMTLLSNRRGTPR